jgi:hypothetical protein
MADYNGGQPPAQFRSFWSLTSVLLVTELDKTLNPVKNRTARRPLVFAEDEVADANDKGT